jgi:hypothetical protein
VQLGGIIYLALLLVVTLVLLQLIPVFNIMGQTCFEGCQVARSGMAAAAAAKEVAGDLNLEKEGGDLTDILKGGAEGGAEGVEEAGKAEASEGANDAGETFNQGLVNACSSQAPSYSTSVEDEYLSPQQMRSVMRRRRGESGTYVASTAQSVASFGRRALRLGGTPPECDERLLGNDHRNV